jgi:hypothetical protein
VRRQQFGWGTGITALAQWLVVDLPDTNQELSLERLPVDQLLAELSVMKIQLLRKLQDRRTAAYLHEYDDQQGQQGIWYSLHRDLSVIVVLEPR